MHENFKLVGISIRKSDYATTLAISLHSGSKITTGKSDFFRVVKEIQYLHVTNH